LVSHRLNAGGADLRIPGKLRGSPCWPPKITKSAREPVFDEDFHPATDPVYTRIESSLMVPIQGMARLERPDTAKPRLLNLRIYESHNERAARKKIEMFHKGELAIFRRVGLPPVFFGETILGAAMPNLTYLLVFPDEAGREAAWSRFKNDAEWQKLRAIPEYADKEIVSRITNKILIPTSYSEV